MLTKQKQIREGKKNYMEQLLLDGGSIWIPDNCSQTLKQILKAPIDVIYIIRKQVEREE